MILNFITDFTKTSITSLSSICFGFILDINTVSSTDKFISTLSLILGCAVAILALINGGCKVVDNFNKFKDRYKEKCKLKKQLKK